MIVTLFLLISGLIVIGLYIKQKKWPSNNPIFVNIDMKTLLIGGVFFVLGLLLLLFPQLKDALQKILGFVFLIVLLVDAIICFLRGRSYREIPKKAYLWIIFWIIAIFEVVSGICIAAGATFAPQLANLLFGIGLGVVGVRMFVWALNYMPVQRSVNVVDNVNEIELANNQDSLPAEPEQPQNVKADRRGVEAPEQARERVAKPAAAEPRQESPSNSNKRRGRMPIPSNAVAIDREELRRRAAERLNARESRNR